MNTEQQVALVTGASSGFGARIADTLARKGYVVYGTSRRQQPDRAGVQMRVLDVTDPASVQTCIDGIIAENGRLDLLVNNAGRTVSALAEETPLPVAEQLFQTNFFGVARVTNAALPHMRRQQSGKIILMSSLAGLVGTPGQAYYAATKHALEGYGETLRIEVEQFGIFVSLIEPSFFRTEIHQRAEPSEVTSILDYDPMRHSLEDHFARSVAEGDDPQKVADLVARIAAERRPRLRYRIGSDAVWVPRVKRILPESLFFGGMRRQFGL
jgi:NAD(P)-dependent dehydrogenase (short-subunit alcohol dehydrogenase family)